MMFLAYGRGATQRYHPRTGPSGRPLSCRFLQCGSGIAAVEFGLLGGMFILFISFWLELGLDLFMQTALDNAVRNASRLIKTGAITSSGASTFSTKLCTDLSFIMTCSNIKYNVVSGSTFASLSATITTDSSNTMTGTQFSPGTSGQNVLVQVSYTRPIYIPIVSSFLGKNGNILTYSSVAFQKEPY